MISVGDRFGKLVTTNRIDSQWGTSWECLCDCGKTCKLQENELRGGRKSCGCLKPASLESYVGQRFGKLTVIEIRKNKRGKRQLWCECDCGRSILTASHPLRRGNTKSCGCFHKNSVSDRFWKGCGDLSGAYFSSIRKEARYRKIPFEITIEDCWEKFLCQNGFCALSGEKLNLVRDSKNNFVDQNASLDRIDSSRGYMVDNIQWTTKTVNHMKKDLPESRFIELCGKVTTFDGVFSRLEYIEPKRRGNWRGCGELSGDHWSAIKKRAIKLNKGFDVDIKYAWGLFVRQGGVCALSGEKISFKPTKYSNSLKTASLDRIDSGQGYNRGNLQWVHKETNSMKHDLETTEFIRICGLITKLRGVLS